jgi:hypothetical protein
VKPTLFGAKFLAAAACAAIAGSASAAALTPGNLLVYRLGGDGNTAPTGSTATGVYLD